MATLVRIFLLLTVAGAIAGCGANWMSGGNLPGASRSAPPPPPPADMTYLRDATVKPDTGLEVAPAMDSALKWSEKCSKLSEELVRTQQQRRDAEEQSRKLNADIAKLRGEIDQYKKELGEANVMLLEVRQELDKWKANVLGFRDEMRGAQAAQLEALRKVLELLGGETPKQASGSTTQPAVNPTSAAKDMNHEVAKDTAR